MITFRTLLQASCSQASVKGMCVVNATILLLTKVTVQLPRNNQGRCGEHFQKILERSEYLDYPDHTGRKLEVCENSDHRKR